MKNKEKNQAHEELVILRYGSKQSKLCFEGATIFFGMGGSQLSENTAAIFLQPPYLPEEFFMTHLSRSNIFCPPL